MTLAGAGGVRIESESIQRAGVLPVNLDGFRRQGNLERKCRNFHAGHYNQRTKNLVGEAWSGDTELIVASRNRGKGKMT